MTGVYIIKNTLNGRCYVGSSKRIKRRISQHMSNLKGGYHENKNIQSDFNLYGEYFSISILEFCNNYKDREQHYIDTLKPVYNIYPNSKSPIGSVWQKGHKRHRFIQVYTDDKLIGIYLGPKEVSEKLGLAYSSVSGVLYGKRNSLKGYKIKYII